MHVAYSIKKTSRDTQLYENLWNLYPNLYHN